MPTNSEGLLGLIDVLRTAGFAVPTGSLIALLEAVQCLDDDLHSIYWAGRTTLTHSPQEIELFDTVYRHWILGTEMEMVATAPPATQPLTVDGDEAENESQDETSDATVEATDVLRFSRTETLHSTDFAALTDDERNEADQLIAVMRVNAATRRSRRRRPSKRANGTPDLRRTVRESLRTGGEPFHRRTLERRRVARRVVLIADISGSMASYSRALLRYAHAAVSARTSVEAFALGTRLTRVTRELATRDPDRALQRASASIEDWSGGTRLGDGLRQFNDLWGTKGMARGAIIVILSDGWDRGEPELVATEMARLSRVAYEIVWVNPLKASEGYAPLARGMAAALPFVDEFVEGHSLESLERLSSLLSRGTSSPIRSWSTTSA